MLRLPRKTFRLIVGVYTSHNCLNRHLSVRGLINSPKCGNCNEADETATAATMGQLTRIWGKPFLHPSEVHHITVRHPEVFNILTKVFIVP